MQVSEAWLRQYVNPSITTEELVSQLTMAGLEIDAVEPAAAEFNKVVVAEVVSTLPHENADKLKVCQVNVGSETLQIVCGAANVREGLKVPAALIGAVLPGNFKIKKSKLRGVESFGMLCSEKELGLAADASGLMELASDAPVGKDMREYLSLEDQVLELDLTPNRADCLSVEGVAREIAVLNEMDWQSVDFQPVAVNHQQTLDVKIEVDSICPRYLGRLIHGVNPKAETPLWMQERLRRSGLRSLGAVVDITNYVLLELGQPLHAFDADKIQGSIQVRKSQNNEKLALLNDQTIELDGEAVVIADDENALAFAGVMGGQPSSVTESTTDIFLECAYFSPVSIAGKARQFGLHTDSSHRFERGVDFSLQSRAIERASQLIVDVAGGSAGPINEVVIEENLPERSTVLLRKERIKKLLSVEIADEQVVKIFQRLGMVVESVEQGWNITPPGWRFDITIEADLIEELARIFGYNNIPNNSLLMRSELVKTEETILPVDRIEDFFVDRGYQEAITYSFVDEEIQQLIAPNDTFIRISNPISSELSVMRTTLWCGLLNAALYNNKRQQERIRLFESGLRFIQVEGETVQQKMIAGLILGDIDNEHWAEKNRKVDFFDLKGDLEALFQRTGYSFKFVKADNPALHPGQSADMLGINNEKVGQLGMLHPTLEKKLGFNTPVFLFEMQLDEISDRKLPAFKPLSKFPSVKRDLALIVNESVSAEDLINTIIQSGGETVQDVQVFDVYRGSSVEKGFKSMALSLVLQDDKQTLTDLEIDAIFSSMLEKLNEEFGAKLRD